MSVRWALGIGILFLTGCATTMNKNEQKIAQAKFDERRAAVGAVDRFTLRGRISSGFAMRGDLRWQQNADGSFEARVSGPFGIGALTISGTEDEVEVRTKSGVYKTKDPEGWVQQKMGWTFPIMGLRYWVLGLAWPHSKAEQELNLAGQVETLEQDGWTLDYQEYSVEKGLSLPKKFEIANPKVKIKVVIDAWDELSAPTQVAKR
jgi:outer membrane lipoprotein LolB